MKIFAFALALAATTVTTQAASHEHDMSEHQAIAQPAARHAGVGVLKAVNAKAGKVQIAHEAIADLGWPQMTMWFMLHQPLPQEIQVGDTVQFELMENDRKQWGIVKIGRR